MTISDEITRLQTAKADLKTSINAKLTGTPIANETIDDYADFVDSIQTGGGSLDTYFNSSISAGNSQNSGLNQIIKTIPNNIIISGTSATYMFCNCYSLTSIPLIDTSSIIDMSYMFAYCNALTTIPQLDTSSCTSMSGMFSYNDNLTNLGGFQNLGQAYSTTINANYNNYKLKLSSSPLLTHDSLMNVINNLYDIATKGCNTQSLQIGSTNLAKLTATEIAVATAKGFTVS